MGVTMTMVWWSKCYDQTFILTQLKCIAIAAKFFLKYLNFFILIFLNNLKKLSSETNSNQKNIRIYKLYKNVSFYLKWNLEV